MTPEPNLISTGNQIPSPEKLSPITHWLWCNLSKMWLWSQLDGQEPFPGTQPQRECQNNLPSFLHSFLLHLIFRTGSSFLCSGQVGLELQWFSHSCTFHNKTLKIWCAFEIDGWGLNDETFHPGQWQKSCDFRWGGAVSHCFWSLFETNNSPEHLDTGSSSKHDFFKPDATTKLCHTCNISRCF